MEDHKTVVIYRMVYFHISVVVILKIWLSTNKWDLVSFILLSGNIEHEIKILNMIIQNWNVVAKEESEMKPNNLS